MKINSSISDYITNMMCFTCCPHKSYKTTTNPVANILSVLRILHATVAFQLVGPLLISFGAIVKDVFKFACLFVFVLMAFALGLTELYSTYAVEYRMECEEDPLSDACDAMSFER